MFLKRRATTLARQFCQGGGRDLDAVNVAKALSGLSAGEARGTTEAIQRCRSKDRSTPQAIVHFGSTTNKDNYRVRHSLPCRCQLKIMLRALMSRLGRWSTTTADCSSRKKR